MTVSVKICSGTACYVMGGAELLSIGDQLTDEEKQQVKIEASTCMGVCDDYGPQTPYATVNDELITHATPEILLNKIRKYIADERQE